MRTIIYDNSANIYSEDLPPGVAFDGDIPETAVTYYNEKLFMCRQFETDEEAEAFLQELAAARE